MSEKGEFVEALLKAAPPAAAAIPAAAAPAAAPAAAAPAASAPRDLSAMPELDEVTEEEMEAEAEAARLKAEAFKKRAALKEADYERMILELSRKPEAPGAGAGGGAGGGAGAGEPGGGAVGKAPPVDDGDGGPADA